MTTGERVKKVRECEALTMDKFGEKLGVSKAAISNIESDKRGLTDQMLRSICREFGVNETWLRTGAGEMRQALTEDEELAEFTGKVLSAAPEDIRKRLLSAVAKWTPEMWTLAEKIAEQWKNKEHPDG